MAINSDIRDQAYQFFTEEAPELLQVLEAGLLTLAQERSTAQVHNLMRAAHSIKGGASSVGLDAIATLAHRLENILKALYSDTLEIDTKLENDLLQAYDCVRLPLMEQITTGNFDAEAALAIAEPILTQIEARCGEALLQAETYLPSSAELGMDMVTSIFEIDVVQGLDRLVAVLAHPQDYEVAGELRAQIEVFIGFAELLNLPEFKAIAETAQQALNANPDRALEIMQLTLTDLERSRQAVLAGNRTPGLEPSAALSALAAATTASSISADEAEKTEQLKAALPQLESIFGLFGGAVTTADAELEASPLAINLDDDLDNLEDEPLPTNAFALHLDEALDEELSSTKLMGSAIAAEMEASEVIEAEWVASIASQVENNSYEQTLDPPGSLIPSELSQHALQISRLAEPHQSTDQRTESTSFRQVGASAQPNLTVRVSSDQLEQMSNLVGELSINRNGLSLQNEQLQGVLRELLSRFSRFEDLVSDLRESLDQMLVAPERHSYVNASGSQAPRTENGGVAKQEAHPFTLTAHPAAEFDSLEMDSYGVLHAQLQEILENFVQLDETVDDITLYARQSDRLLNQQRHMLASLNSELTQARMVPLGEVLNRFPRVLRDLSATYHKPVSLKLTGTGLLVDRSILEKLYDPLVHLLRNAFDHGIESPSVRHQLGKPEDGQIEIRAYHKGNQTVIEIKDDGQGLNLDRIRRRAFELGWLSAEQLLVTSPTQLFELIFEPGFSTAQQVSELSGRGIGLDVVRSQLQSIKGTVAVTSSPRQGATFTLRLPLTLTNTKLIICSVGAITLALPVESVEEILTPQTDQTRHSGAQRFLYWREQIIPAYRLADLLDYACPIPEVSTSKPLVTRSTPKAGAAPMLVLHQQEQMFAIEVEQLITEQELVIKSFGSTIAPPNYFYGCTSLGDGSLIPVIDISALLAFEREQSTTRISTTEKSQQLGEVHSTPSIHNASTVIQAIQTTTILVVDDAVTLRRTLALALERAGFRVLQARDGQEAIDQCQRSSVHLVICDIEMPNMNGFEFLSYRRQAPQISKIPIMMLTSRSNEKHRWLAMQLGATAYFTKPYLEQEFLAAIKTLIKR